VALRPSGAAVPVLSEALLSDSVLAPGNRDGGATVTPTGVAAALASPYSSVLFSLAGMPAANAWVSIAFWAGASPAPAAGGAGCEGALSVLRAAARAATSSGVFFLAMVGVL